MKGRGDKECKYMNRCCSRAHDSVPRYDHSLSLTASLELQIPEDAALESNPHSKDTQKVMSQLTAREVFSHRPQSTHI